MCLCLKFVLQSESEYTFYQGSVDLGPVWLILIPICESYLSLSYLCARTCCSPNTFFAFRTIREQEVKSTFTVTVKDYICFTYTSILLIKAKHMDNHNINEEEKCTLPRVKIKTKLLKKSCEAERYKLDLIQNLSILKS